MDHISLKLMSLLLLVAVPSYQRSPENSPCGITTRSKIKTCRNANLTRIPWEHLSSDSEGTADNNACFETLDLSVNMILLNTNDLLKISCTNSIKTFYLNYNQISKIPSIFFSKLNRLQSLYLSNNNLTRIGKELCYIINLEELEISENPIANISRNAFRCLKNLKHLFMNNTILRKLPEDLFEGTTLETLHLFGSCIKNWDNVYLPKTLKELIPPDQIKDCSTTSSAVTTTTDRSTRLLMAVLILVILAVLWKEEMMLNPKI